MTKSRFHRKNGQAILEMSILLPFFLLVIVGGIIDFGFAFYNFLSLQQLSNDAAIYAAEGNGRTGITSSQLIDTYVQTRKPNWWAGAVTLESFETVPIQGGSGSADGADLKRVSLSYTSPMFTPFYQTMFSALSGTDGLKLSVMSAYQVPKVVATR
jgi:Flp pilus assembly protein TadG